MEESAMPSIVLTRAEHAAFTRAWISVIPNAKEFAARWGQELGSEIIMNHAKVIYKDYPGILSVLGINP